MNPSARRNADIRIPPIDIARGLSVLLVVSVHTILGIDAVAGQRSGASWLVDFANAFRIPAFFLIAGLYLRRAMTLSWVDLFRKRIFGLLVLFAIWSALHITIRHHQAILTDPISGLFGQAGVFMKLVSGLIEPSGLFLFLYLMIIFLLMARAVFFLPSWLVLGTALLMETTRISTGMILFDEFSSRFFYFYLGMTLAPLLFPAFRGAMPVNTPPQDRIPASNAMLCACLALWLILHSLGVQNGIDHWRGMSILTALAGIAALFAIGLLLARLWPEGWLTRLLRLIGTRSIVIFLVFAIPMAAFRHIGFALWPGISPGLLAVIVIFAALGISILVERLVRGTWLARLFEQPVLGGPKQDSR